MSKTVLGSACWSIWSLWSIIYPHSLKFQEFHKVCLACRFTALPFLLCWILISLQTQKNMLQCSNHKQLSFHLCIFPFYHRWTPEQIKLGPQIFINTFHFKGRLSGSLQKSLSFLLRILMGQYFNKLHQQPRLLFPLDLSKYSTCQSPTTENSVHKPTLLPVLACYFSINYWFTVSKFS